MTRVSALFLAALTVTACSSGTVMPTASPQPPAEAVSAFKGTIWPAVAEYNWIQSQGGPGSVAFSKVVDPSLEGAAWGSLRDAIEHLGTVRDDSRDSPGISRDQRLSLASAEVTDGDTTTATLRICYTYTASEWNGTNGAPAASEATVDLRKLDSWKLHGIANDHVVSDCVGKNRS